MISADGKIKASIVISTFNRLSLLKRCLESLKEQTISTNKYEILVVDDGSNDGTREYLMRQRIQVYFNGRNCSRNISRNKGIRNAKGEIIIFIDDDTIVEKDFVEQHLKCYENESCLATVGRVKSAVYKTIYNKYNDTRGPMRLRKRAPVPWKHFVTTNCSVRREVIDKVGLFDERIINYGGDDVEMGFRIKQLEGKIIFAKKAIAYHYGNNSLEERCIKLYEYGNTSFKYILNIHPEMMEGFRLKYFEKFYYRVFWQSFLFRLFYRIYEYVPKFVAYKMISYMLAFSVYMGWKNYDYRTFKRYIFS